MNYQEISIPIVGDVEGLFTRELPGEYERLVQSSQFLSLEVLFSARFIDAYTLDPINKHALLGKRTLTREVTRLFQSLRTPFGEEVAKIIQGRDFVDLGCGSYTAARLLAHCCGAKEYLGIDHLEKTRQIRGKFGGSNFTSTILRHDMLQAIARRDSFKGVAFHLAGIEPRELETLSNEQYNDQVLVDERITETNKDYIDACFREMIRLSQSGDAIVIGPAVFGFYPERYGFSLAHQAPNVEYRLFVRD